MQTPTSKSSSTDCCYIWTWTHNQEQPVEAWSAGQPDWSGRVSRGAHAAIERSHWGPPDIGGLGRGVPYPVGLSLVGSSLDAGQFGGAGLQACIEPLSCAGLQLLEVPRRLKPRSCQWFLERMPLKRCSTQNPNPNPETQDPQGTRERERDARERARESARESNAKPEKHPERKPVQSPNRTHLQAAWLVCLLCTIGVY